MADNHLTPELGLPYHSKSATIGSGNMSPFWVSQAIPSHQKDTVAMFNPFKPLELIKAEVFTSLPPQFRKRRRTAWSDPNRQGAEVECFLEGPSFDREGNLWIVDIPFGRI